MAMATEFSCGGERGAFEKAATTGEQLFTLRAQDETTPECIAYWILKNIETAPEEKLRHALDDALRARKWPNRKQAD
jgi:hypothetical protein